MMRLLTQDFFAQSPVLLFPLVALCLFMGVFTLVSARALLTRKESYQPMANLPLEDAQTDTDHASDARDATDLGAER